ncbi:hypothetical protein [Campylobacter sp. US33a]|uniref:Uncharacterized protein n=1 Tax=Campylobacter sp. CCS1377 TaxID=3158229 RepID=A0AAU7E9K0_9BACT|nr:hypothetical protein [Campylobacter sp. US33a]MCW1360769.1 hypothetical protein [Campylobacter jejuni]TEY00542.1 hypothetical protein ELQ16_08985 [Campylobacter sp. US33a]
MNYLLFLILFCSAFLLIMGINYEILLQNFKEQMYFVFLSSIILLTFGIFIFRNKEKKQNKNTLQKIFNILDLFSIHKEEQNLNQNLHKLEESCDILLKKHQKLLNEKQIYTLSLEEILYNLENLANAIYYIDHQHSQTLIDTIIKTIKEQKEQIKFTLGKTSNYQKPLSSLDKLPYYNANAVIINDDELENFLLQNLLSQFGIKSMSFHNFTPEASTYHLTFIKDYLYKKEYYELKNVILFGKDSREKTNNYLSLPIHKENLKPILEQLLKDGDFTPQVNECISNVLIFKQNKFENELFFNIIDKCYAKNQVINSLSGLKHALEKTMFRLIMLDFEVIKYDLESVKFLLNHYKKQYPQAHTIIFIKHKDRELLKDCDFISEILDEDINKNDLISLLKKYINQYKS